MQRHLPALPTAPVPSLSLSMKYVTQPCAPSSSTVPSQLSSMPLPHFSGAGVAALHALRPPARHFRVPGQTPTSLLTAHAVSAPALMAAGLHVHVLSVLTHCLALLLLPWASAQS